MEVDWGGNLKHNYTSSGSMLMEVDWGGKLIINSRVDWGAHETHPNGHNISEIDWGSHGSSSNHMTEFLVSEVDWGGRDSSFFLFLVNIDYDAETMEFFTQGLWGEVQQTMSSTPLIWHMYLYIGMYHDFVMDDLSIKFLRIHIIYLNAFLLARF